ncbi:protein DA1 [Spirochaeta isovalerica]|uniref:Protein DA1-like domain-containing protein n=1 Tax=Spirochaeta isovalerica TaxID=150 RepID=A0A841R945_9SPIO|nr:hypothetical protein [Spirochaeta isovalerica]
MINRPLCGYCKRPVTDQYFRDYWGNMYCAVHLNREPQCDYCGRLISRELTKGGMTYSDGRRICGLCKATSVDKEDKGLRLLQLVHDVLAFQGIEISPFKPEFYLIDRSRLKKLGSKSETRGFARYTKETVNGKVTDFRLMIYILKGMPESSFISACAHELMHIWFYSRGLTGLSPRLEEGSCNYAAYLILKTLNSPEAAYRIHELMEDRSPVYGKGFQKVLKMVEGHGVPYWLEYLQKR